MRLVIAVAVFWLAISILARSESSYGAVVFNVNSPADVVDALPGDGICSTAVPNNGVCTLRAAVQETNALAGADTINLLAIPYTLSIPGTGDNDTTSANGDLNIKDDLTINGVAGSTSIDGNGGVTGERVFSVDQDQTVSLSGLTITGGRSSGSYGLGGGILNEGFLTLDRVTMTNNIANGGLTSRGGAIYSGQGLLTITDSTISGNSTGIKDSYGGAILSSGVLTITGSTISGNTVNGTPGYGGGISAGGESATIRNSTVSGNTALHGGGIYKFGIPVYIINSTVSGNSANQNGGGVYAQAGTMGLYSSTVANNRANADAEEAPGVGYGGGVYVEAITSATVSLANTIIADNGEYVYAGGAKPPVYDSNCYGTMSSAGNNIVPPSHLTECTVTGSSVSTADPMLAPLLSNGGPTRTHAIPAGSPAVDTGNPGGCTDSLGAPLPTDQRGYARSGPRCDIGAFEYNGIAPATPTPSPTPDLTATASPSSTPTTTGSATPTTTGSATPTPTQTATATPSAAPTNTPSADRTQGDVNCDGDVDVGDFGFLLEFAAGLNDGTTPGTCPDLESTSISSVGHPWGDVNCDDDVNAMDALFVLAHVAEVDLLQEAGCTQIGSDFT